jgi:hypothetical protein
MTTLVAFDYFDIDEILAEEEACPCKFLTDACKLGFLDHGSGEPDMRRGVEIELPLWLVQVLKAGAMVAIDRSKMKVCSVLLLGVDHDLRQIVFANCTQGYDDKFRDDLEADAKTKSFSRYPYFYTVGMILGKL